MHSRITMEDIAKEAGISKMSVSLALRNDPSISQETRERIKKISKKMGYIPNRMAKGLAQGRTYTIAALAGGGLHDGYNAQILKSAGEYALKRGYTLTAALSEANATAEMEAIKKFYEIMVDGFLVFHCNNIENYRIFKEQNTPFVMYTKYFKEMECDYVVCDDVKGGELMTRHMIDAGHKSIAYVYDSALYNNSEITNRLQGYKNVLAENQIPFDESFVIPYKFDFFDHTNAIKSNSELLRCLQSPTPPTAIFACNDTIAVALYTTLKYFGYKIPQDISVGGYEGVYLGEIVDPTLTTITSPIEQMGKIACKLLIDKIEGLTDPHAVSHISLEPTLTIRNSISKK